MFNLSYLHISIGLTKTVDNRVESRLFEIVLLISLLIKILINLLDLVYLKLLLSEYQPILLVYMSTESLC